MEANDNRLRDIQRQYVEYLEENEESSVRELLNSSEGKSRRLIVDINDLRKKYPLRATALLEDCFDEIIAFHKALAEFSAAMQPSKTSVELFVGFQGSFGPRHLTPRSLASRHLNNLVCVEGIITKVSLVRPKIVQSVHYCPATSKSMERSYTDITSIDSYSSSAAYPTTDEDGNPLQTEYGLSIYKDHQSLTIQELPEKAPTGQLPRSVDVIVEYDLVDIVKPGDRVQIVGAYRCLPGKYGGFTSGTFKTMLLANNITLFNEESDSFITAEDVIQCKKINKTCKNIFSLLANSLAPSIHGHDHVKKALLSMLLGGVEKILPNGSRIRGDINLLLIGDPSVAKSQMLRYVLATAPRAIATTGRGSSGVGLTAAVTTDHETGERRLEAGAMVLGDRGVVCIDEFDKMTDIDRTAIHEVMEQGRVTISKAGIHARLNARCSVLAAANPVYGRYDPFKPPMENIGLQDSLLSRFDLLFILLDTVDVESDRKISDHVLRVHRYRNPNEEDGAVTLHNSDVNDLTTKKTFSSETEPLEVWDKMSYLDGKHRRFKNERLTPAFVKKYIEIAKCMRPVLTEEACEVIGEEYSKLRSQDWEGGDVARTQPVTARALETMIRLSSAHAKARLSKVVTVEDAESAIELVQFAYFKKVFDKVRKRRHKSEDDENEDEEEIENEVKNNDKMNVCESEEIRLERKEKNVTKDKKSPKRRKEEKRAVIDVTHKMEGFMKELLHGFAQKHAQSLSLESVKSLMGEKLGLSDPEILACIEQMSEDNKIMLSDGTLYLI